VLKVVLSSKSSAVSIAWSEPAHIEVASIVAGLFVFDLAVEKNNKRPTYDLRFPLWRAVKQLQ
jgi:hypothetical protein